MDRRLAKIALLPTLLLASACATGPQLTRPPGEAAPTTTLFEGVRVFDGVSDGLTGPMDVLVVGDRIEAIAEAGSLEAPKGAHLVKGEGRTLMPGLFDAHVHVGMGNGEPPWEEKHTPPEHHVTAMLNGGVTSALVASRGLGVHGVRDAIRAGEVDGPRLSVASRMYTTTDGHPTPFFRALVPWAIRWIVVGATTAQVGNDEELADAMEKTADEKPDFVKIAYNAIPTGGPHLKPEMLKKIIAAAHKEGFEVIIHVGNPEEAITAAEAGAKLLMHTPWERRFTDEEVTRLAATGVPMVTTGLIWGTLAEAMSGTWRPGPLEKATVRQVVLDALQEGAGDYTVDKEALPPEFLAKAAEFHKLQGENLWALYRGGVPLIMGTDTAAVPGLFHGAATHRELAYLVSLGFTPADVLRMSTSGPADLLTPDANIGRVEAGRVADLLLIDGDPFADMSATQNIIGVWRGGREVERVAPEW